MLYPSYYFDAYDEIINKKESEKKLKTIIDRIEEYEMYLWQIHVQISKKIQIKKVDWINEK